MDDSALLLQLSRLAEQQGELRAEVAISATRVETLVAQVLEAIHSVQTTQLDFGQRLVALESRVTKYESEPPNHPPSLPDQTTIRAPAPSLTSEERAAQSESIRVAVAEQTPYLERLARSSRWTPFAIAMGMGLAAFVSSLLQSCQWRHP